MTFTSVLMPLVVSYHFGLCCTDLHAINCRCDVGGGVAQSVWRRLAEFEVEGSVLHFATPAPTLCAGVISDSKRDPSGGWNAASGRLNTGVFKELLHSPFQNVVFDDINRLITLGVDQGALSGVPWQPWLLRPRAVAQRSQRLACPQECLIYYFILFTPSKVIGFFPYLLQITVPVQTIPPRF